MKEEGATLKEIAEKSGVGRSTINKWTKGAKSPSLEIEKNKAINMRKEGFSLREVAKDLGISNSTVYKWTKEST